MSKAPSLDDQHYFIIGNLDLPVRGSSEVIRWTLWSTLGKASFERCSELWEAEGRESEPPYFGWLSNSVPGYTGAINIALAVHTQPLGFRPKLEVIDAEHPLHTDQKHGITPARADELIHIALYGSDRPR